MDGIAQTFASPLFIALAWPIVFVVVSVGLNVLSADDLRADGDRKYRVICKNSNGTQYTMAHIDLNHLKDSIKTDDKIDDIEVLQPGLLGSFSMGIDLAIGSLATDLTVMYSAAKLSTQQSTSNLIIVSVSVLILHFTLALVIVLILKLSSRSSQELRPRFVWAANVMGIIAVFASFITLGQAIAGSQS